MPSQSEIIESLQFEFMADLQPVTTSSDPAIVLTYQFAGDTQPDDLPTSSNYTGWEAMTEAEEAAVREALDHIETLINVEFVEVTGDPDPDFNIGKAQIDPWGGYGGNSVSWNGNLEITDYDGYVIFDADLDMSDPANFSLLLHELGHALGLDHPFDGVVLDPDYDSNKYTVMSYDSNPDNGLDSNAMMIYDILALQDIWGAADSSPGDDTYTGPRTTTVDAVWDSGGTDHIDGSDWSGGIRIDLREGYFSQFGSYEDLVIAYGTVIENATGGAGNDTITGNDVDNILIGNAGHDTLDGLNGEDRLEGNGGKDSLDGGAQSDLIKGGGGKDTLVGSGGKDTLDGGNGNDSLTGGNGNDTLRGSDGKDKLDGQGGDDTLKGGADADTFLFKAGKGNDTIKDFETGLDMIKFKKLGDTGTVLAAATEIDDDVVFDFGSDGSLTVLNVSLADLSGDVFV